MRFFVDRHHAKVAEHSCGMNSVYDVERMFFLLVRSSVFLVVFGA